MCYLVRQDTAEESVTPPVSAPDRRRTRWAGVAAAAVMSGLAFAALVTPSPTSPLSGQKAVPVAAMRTTAPATAERLSVVIGGGGIGQAALPGDDGVPTPDVARAGLAPCHEGL